MAKRSNVPRPFLDSGIRLQAARKDKRLTLEQVSKRTGGVVSGSRLSNFEQGIRRMTPEIATLLGSILSVTPFYLLCMETTEEDDMTPQEQELLKHFRALDEADRERALIHIEVMAIPHRKAKRPSSKYRSPANRPAPAAKK